MPRQFWTYTAFSSLTMFGYATFGLLLFHLVTTGLLTPRTGARPIRGSHGSGCCRGPGVRLAL